MFQSNYNRVDTYATEAAPFLLVFPIALLPSELTELGPRLELVISQPNTFNLPVIFPLFLFVMGVVSLLFVVFLAGEVLVC